MAKKEKLETDEFNFDDDLNIPDLNFDSEDVVDNRKPTTKIADSIRAGVKQSLKDPALYERMARAALPKEYGTALDDAAKVKEGIKSVYKGAVKEIKPATNDLARAAQAMVPDSMKRVKGVLKRVEEWSKDSPNSAKDDLTGQREDNIALELGNIFKEQMTEQVKARAEDDAKKKVDDALSVIRHRDQMSAFNAMSMDLSRMRQYQSQVTQAYQKKSLELQYRSYYVQADTLEVQRKTALAITARLDAIQKNTGLPDFVKTRSTEYAKEVMRNQFITSGLGGLFGDRGAKIEKFFENIGTKVREKVSDAAEAMGAAAMGLDAAAMAKDLGGKSGLETGTEMATGMGMNALAAKFGRGIRHKMQKGAPKLTGKIDEFAQTYRYAHGNMGGIVKDWSRSQTDPNMNGLKRGAIEFLKDLVGDSLSSNATATGMQTDSLRSMREQTGFTNQANKSLTEVIPGLLSRILREVYVARTKDDKVGLVEYDYKSNKFSTTKKIVAQMREDAVNKSSADWLSRNFEDRLSSMGLSNQLDDEDKKAFAAMILRGQFNDASMSPEFFSDAKNYKHAKNDKHAEKLAGIMSNHFLAGDVDEDKRKLIQKTRRAEMSEFGRSVGTELNDSRAFIQDHINAGNAEKLQEAGLLSPDGKSLDIDEIIKLAIANIGTRHSDIFLKENIKPIDPKKALFGIRNTPVSQWTYKQGNKASDGGFAHIGPMAQDIKASFGDGVAPGGKKIDMGNLMGANMAATQALDQKTQSIGDVLKQQIGIVHSLLKFTSKKTEGAASGDKSKPMTFETRMDNIQEALNLIAANTSMGINRVDLSDLITKGGALHTKLGNYFRTNKDTLLGKASNLLGSTIDFGASAASSIFGIGKSIKDHGVKNAQLLKDKVFWPGYEKGKEFVNAKIQFGRDFKNQTVDLYVRGSLLPRLTKAKLLAGDYRDQATGEIIRTLKDIKGAVIDEAGNVVLTVQDLRNSFTKIPFSHRIKELGKELFSKLKDTAEIGFSLVPKFYQQAWGLGKKLVIGALNLLDEPKDIFVRGGKEPVLYKTLMEAGHYFNKSDSSRIKRPGDIKGPVIDSEGNTVLTLMQFRKGLVDVKGNEIKSAVGRLKDITTDTLQKGVAMMKNAVVGGASLVKSVATDGIEGVKKFAGNMNLGIGLGGKKSNELLTSIRDILDARLPGKKKKALGDNDGDGDRDGSWQDKKQNEKKKEDAKARELKTISYKGKNIFDFIQEKVSGAIGGVVDTVLGALGLGGLLGGKGKGANVPKGGKLPAGVAAGAKKSLLGRILGGGASLVGGAVKTGLGAAGLLGKGVLGLGKLGWGGTKLAGRALPGIGVATGLGFGAKALYDGNYGEAALNLGLAGVSGLGVGGMLAAGGAAVTALGSVLFSPVLLGGAALAGVGYGSYKAFKWATKKRFSDLSRFRMVQYGVGPKEDELHQRFYALEKFLQPFVQVKDDDAQLREGKIDIDKMLSIFDIAQGEEQAVENFGQWFQGRFKPVYLTHMRAIKKLANKADLDLVDDLKPREQIQFIDMVAMPDGPWSVGVLPFKTQSKSIIGASFIAKAAQELRAKIAAGIKPGHEGNEPQSFLGKLFKPNKIDGIVDNVKLGANETKISTEIAKAMRADMVMKGSVAGISVGSEKTSTWFFGAPIKAFEAVRLKAYGLEKTDQGLVASLRWLEVVCQDQLMKKPDKTVVWNGDAKEMLTKARKYFGFGEDNAAQEKNWISWFIKRFLPVYTTYIARIAEVTNSDNLKNAIKIFNPESFEAATISEHLVGMSSVWNVTTSPWEGVTLLTDTTKTKENIDFIKKAAKDKELLEQKLKESQATKNKPGEPTQKVKTAEEAQVDAMKKSIEQGKKRQAAIDAAREGSSGSSAAAYSEEGEPDQKPSTTSTPEVKKSEVTKGSSASAAPAIAKGELTNGSGANQYLTGPGVKNLQGVRPEFLKLFMGAVQEYGEKTGKKITINSGFRSYEQQAALKKKYGKGAANPGNSLHEFGMALDIESADANAMEKLGLMKKYGLTRPVGQEPWHVEPAGIQDSLNQVRKDLSFADTKIASGVGRGGGGFGTQPNAAKYGRNPELAKYLFDLSPDAGKAVAEYKTESTTAAVAGTPKAIANEAIDKAKSSSAAAVSPTKAGGGYGGKVATVAADQETPSSGSSVSGGASTSEAINQGSKGGLNASEGQSTIRNLLDQISKGEGTSDENAKRKGFASGYDVPLGFGKFGMPEKPITQMTLGELKAYQQQVRKASGKMNSSAMGKYQIVGTTLSELQEQLKLPDSAKFTPELQDKMAMMLLKRRGLDKFTSGKMTGNQFQASLYKEWASIAHPDTGKALQHTGTSDSDIKSALAGLKGGEASSSVVNTSFTPTSNKNVTNNTPVESRAAKSREEVAAVMAPINPAPRQAPIIQPQIKKTNEDITASVKSVESILTESLSVQKKMLQALEGFASKAGATQKAEPKLVNEPTTDIIKNSKQKPVPVSMRNAVTT